MRDALLNNFFRRWYMEFVSIFNIGAVLALSILPLIFGIPKAMIPLPFAELLWPIHELVFAACIAAPISFLETLYHKDN